MAVSKKTITFIQNTIHDPNLKFVLSADFSAKRPFHRLAIRTHLADEFTAHFNREQLARLSDLNWVPQAADGFFSISHNQNLGGFSYSKLKHGFDAEITTRISNSVVQRTSSEPERSEVPDIKYLWVAKEAAFKALSGRNDSKGYGIMVTDLICGSWQAHSGSQTETQICSFRITSEKTLEQTTNLGFVFSEEDVLYAIYFK